MQADTCIKSQDYDLLGLMPRKVSDEDLFGPAIAVMVEHGYEGATTRRIAEAAGVNEVTLFRRFGTKAELLRAAMLAQLERVLPPTGLPCTDDVVADLEHVVTAHHGLVSRHGRLVPLLLAELPRNPELADVVAIPQRLLSAIAELLRHHQLAGRLRAEPPFAAVAALLAPVLIPVMLGEHAPPEVQNHEFDARAHVLAFLDGRRAR